MNIQLPEICCTGCGACLQTCKVGAIIMKPQEDGFIYPRINVDQCMHCGQCMQSCHVLDNDMFNSLMSCYAVQSKKKNVISNSSSGGVFYTFAENILKCNGVIYGCVFDEHYNAVIERAESFEQIQPMHGSKYVWSDSSVSYPETKRDLEAGRQVLYTGLPCQTAGLRKYLRKSYDNLYIVDVLCGGAPSPFAFQRYLETLTDETGKKNLKFQFRDKEGKGSGVNCTYFINGVKHNENWLENSFYYAFSSKSRITWRRSCYGCNYKSIRRVSDITIGDYWGIENYHSSFIPQDGVSVVLINTAQGARLFQYVKGEILFEESNVFHVIERNSLVKEIEEGNIQEPSNRADFFRMLSSHGWETVDRKYLNSRKKFLLKQTLVKILYKLWHILREE